MARKLWRIGALIAGVLILGLGIGVMIGRLTAPPPVQSQPARIAAAPAMPAIPPEPPEAEAPAQSTVQTPEARPELAASEALKPAAPADPLWRKYANIVPELGHKPVIALIIDDIGPDRRGTERAIQLPPSVTLSLLPYAKDIAHTAMRARAAGHEILLHMPMQPEGNADPGPDALDAGMPPEEVKARLDRALERFDGYVGMNNHMGSKATRDRAVMAEVMNVLYSRGLIFIDSRTTGHSLGLEAAESAKVPAAARDIFIDDDPSSAAVERQLAATEAYALKHGEAVAIAHPHAASLDSIERWIIEVQRRGVVLVPITEIVRRRLQG